MTTSTQKPIMIFPCDRCGWMPDDCTCRQARTAQPARTKAIARVHAASPTPTPPPTIQLPPDPAGRRWAPVVEVIRETRAAS